MARGTRFHHWKVRHEYKHLLHATGNEIRIHILYGLYCRKCENIYIGWGLKYSSAPFNPALPPSIQEEFPAGADIAETTDPTVEQEAALKAAQEETQANMEEEEEPEESDED